MITLLKAVFDYEEHGILWGLIVIFDEEKYFLFYQYLVFPFKFCKMEIIFFSINYYDNKKENEEKYKDYHNYL